MWAKTIQNGRRGRQDGSMKTVSSAKSCGGPAEGRYIWEIKEKLMVWGSRRGKGPISVTEKADQ